MKYGGKKLLALGVILTMSLGLLSGCSKGNNETAATSENIETSKVADTEKVSDDVITLRFAWWGGDSRHEASLKAIEAYEKLNPNVKVEAEYMGYDGYYEKMMTTLSSGTAPDIFQFHRDWVADVQGADHYLADLSKLPVDLSQLDPGILERSGSYNGEPVLFSCVVGGQVLYINKDFFTSHGLDSNTPFTWESLMEAGKKIHDENPDEYLMAADVDVLNRLIILNYLAQQTGKSLINEEDNSLQFTKEQMQASLENIQKLYSTNTLEPFGESAVFVGVMEQNTRWVNGKIGILMDISGAADKYRASIDEEVDVMHIPSQPNQVCSGVDYGGNMGFCINDTSPNKEEAARFLDWISNDPEAIKILTTCRGVPASKQAMKVLEEEGLLDATVKKASEIIIPNSYSINAISSNTELETIRKDIIQEVIYGDITSEDGAKELVVEYEKVLSALKK